jgi:hypothetical protein
LNLGTSLSQGCDGSIGFAVTALLDKQVLLLANEVPKFSEICELRT